MKADYSGLQDMIRHYWVNESANRAVRESFSTPVEKEYGKPPINLDNESWFDSMGNYWDERYNSSKSLFFTN